MCTGGPSRPKRRHPPPEVEEPKIRTAGEDSSRAQRAQRRRGRRELRRDVPLAPATNLQLGS